MWMDDAKIDGEASVARSNTGVSALAFTEFSFVFSIILGM